MKTNMSFRASDELRARVKAHCNRHGLKIADYIANIIECDLIEFDMLAEKNEHDQAAALRRMVANNEERG